jgi:chorismate synthase
MSSNTFGKIFKFSTFGESHGKSIGCIVDGIPPRLTLNEADIQTWLDKRKPGQNKFTTQRTEPDTVKILSGVFQGKTTGTPIGLLIDNVDARSKDYGDIAEKFRPGHADYTYWKKYGIRDYRGGGRSSARETAMRVATGAIARKVLSSLCHKNIQIRGALTQLGPHKINSANWDWSEVNNNPFFCPDSESVGTWTHFLNSVRKAGSSTGGVIEVHATEIPPGLGSPIYGKLDAEIASALMSINATKGIEIGNGFSSVELSGEENADEMRAIEKNGVSFLSNNAGGILGGISSGQDIIARLAIKPTSSILTPRKTIDIHNKNTEIITKGRHDPCVAIRGVPVAEAMLSIVLADQFLQHRATENND